jgi:hypothetical protein
MKTNILLKILLISSFILSLITCNDREETNPFDTNCPKELFTPTDFKAEQQGVAVKLSWKQENTQISGFVISRNENDGNMNEVARTEKAVTLWNDQTIVGGKKYGYQLLAYAGENQSNTLKVFISPVTGATFTTATEATGLTPFSAVLSGNVSGDGGAPVTERGICYGTSQNPTVSGSKVAAGSGTGEFNITLANLTPNVIYYVRAYAINSMGITYGNQTNFTTPQIQLLATPAIYDVPKESGSRVFTVTSNIDWQLTSDQTWCKPNITNGKGNSPVVATFETNAAIGQRSALLTFSAVGVSNQIVVITQAGTEPPVLTITPENQNVTKVAGSITFTIASNVTWIAKSDQDWCTFTTNSGSGNGTLTTNFTANTANNQRVATVTISGVGLQNKIITLTQAPLISQTWNMANEYSDVSNPNGVWSYGRKLSVATNDFELMSYHLSSGFWILYNGAWYPGITKGIQMYVNDNSRGLPCTRWTCPAAGIYTIDGTFEGQKDYMHLIGYVTKNDSIIYSTKLQTSFQKVAYSIKNISLVPSDHIDFLIMSYDGGSNDHHKVTAIITR